MRKNVTFYSFDLDIDCMTLILDLNLYRSLLIYKLGYEIWKEDKNRMNELMRKGKDKRGETTKQGKMFGSVNNGTFVKMYTVLGNLTKFCYWLSQEFLLYCCSYFLFT